MTYHDMLMAAATVFSGVSAVVVVNFIFRWGRWTGVVDQRFTNVDQRLGNIEERLERRGERRG